MPLLEFVALRSPSSLWLECIASAMSLQKGRRIYYACMGLIVNWVTELHLQHAFFPRIGSQVDLLKDYCKMRNAGLMCHRNSERQRACDRKPKKMRQSLVATDVFMAKHDKRLFLRPSSDFLDFFPFDYFLIYFFRFGECDPNS